MKICWILDAFLFSFDKLCVILNPIGSIAHTLKGGFDLKKYIIALDQGTTSSRAILFDGEQNIVAIAQSEFNQYYPKPGWVEHDPMEIYASQYQKPDTKEDENE